MSKATVGTAVLRAPANTFRIHPSAQRKLIPATLRKIVKDFKPHGLGTFHGVEYEIDGVTAVWIVDGQHRLTALHQLGLGETIVTVLLHTEIKNDKGASDLFLTLNARSAMSGFDEYVNELQRGDPVAVGVAQTVARHGFSVSRNGADGTITCVNTLKGIYQKDSGAALSKTLATVAAAWGHTANAVEGKLIEGVGAVYATYNGKVDNAALVKKLAKYPGGAPGLLGNARALRAIRTASVGRCVGELVVEIYNSGRRTDRLDPL